MIPLTPTQTLCHSMEHGTVVLGPNLRGGYDGMLMTHAPSSWCRDSCLESYIF